MLKPSSRIFLGAAVGFLALSLCIFAATFSPSYNKCEGDYPNKQADLRNRVGLLIECEAVFANENGSAITAIATVLLTMVTVGLVWLGYVQITTGRKQLRAYVAVEDVGVSSGGGLSPPNHDFPGYAVVIKNAGQTPARRVFHSSMIHVTTISAPDLPAIQPQADVAPTTTLMSGGTTNNAFWMPRALKPTEIAAIRDRSAGIFVYGIIKYFDVFDIERETTYRLFYAGSWPPPTKVSMMYHSGGNDMS